MAVDGPCYFADFESVFNACGSPDHARAVLATHATALEKGLSMYKPCDGALSSKGSSLRPLVGSPDQYDASIGDHGAAMVLVAQELNLHEAQALLLLKHWVLSTHANSVIDWVPSNDQLTSLRRFYASQRWHHLLCMRFAAENLAFPRALLGIENATEGQTVSNCMSVSSDAMLIALLEEIGLSMEKRRERPFLTNSGQIRVQLEATDWRAGAPNQAACELCLMLQVMLYLLPATNIALGSVLKAVKHIIDGIGQLGRVAWDDRGTVYGLLPRYAVAGMLHIFRCRDAVESLEAPETTKHADADHIDAIIALSEHILISPLSETPALAPCMLACAAQLLARGSGVEADKAEICRKLVLAAETCSPIVAVNELLSHQALTAEHPGGFTDAIFYAIGSWCHVFPLEPSTMAKDVLYEFLSVMSKLLCSNAGALAMKVWSGVTGTKFIWQLVEDSCSLFPVFPVAYATFLASLCAGRDSRQCTWQALQDLASFTAYLDEDTQKALNFCGSEVIIQDHVCTALQQVVFQVAHVREPGRLVPMPQLANSLNVGSGCLVQWTLPGQEVTGLGLVLMIEEIMDRADKLQAFLSQHGEIFIIEHIVQTLAACTSLIFRVLHHDPWRALDLLHRRVHGADVAGYAVCIAAQNLLSVIGLNSSALIARARVQWNLLEMLATTAGNCMRILDSVALMLPAAVLQVLTAELNGAVDAPGNGPIWLFSVLDGVHQLESLWGQYPTAVASIKLVESLLKCMDLTDELSVIATQVASSIGCYHTQWHLQDSACGWDVTTAVLSMLYCALGCSGLQQCTVVCQRERATFLNSLLVEGVLQRLFWANMPEPQVPRQAAELFSAVPGKQIQSAVLSMQCVVRMVNLALDIRQEMVLALCQFLFSEQGTGWSVVAVLNSYATEICTQGGNLHDVPLQFITSLMLLVAHATESCAELVPEGSFASLMHTPETGMAEACEPTVMLRHVLVAPLAIDRCIQDCHTASMASRAIETCLLHHPSCAKLLLWPHQLDCGPQTKDEAGDLKELTIDPMADSLIDVLWTSVQAMSKPTCLTGVGKDFGCVAPILQTLSFVIGSGGPAGTILISQPEFWQHLQAVWQSAAANVDGLESHWIYPDACIAIAAPIVDIVSFVLYHHWHDPEQRSGLPIIAQEHELFVAADSGIAKKYQSAHLSASLFNLFKDICMASPPGHGLHDFLQRWGPKSVHKLLQDGEVSLTKASQAAALLVYNFLDSSIPAELRPHALRLWQELDQTFSEPHAASDRISPEDMCTRKLRWLEGMLGPNVGYDKAQGPHADAIHDYCLSESRCHLPILSRMHNGSHNTKWPNPTDPRRWLMLAEDLHMLEQSSNSFHHDACHRIFDLFQQALFPIHQAAAVNGLLRAYTKLLTVAVSHDEGVHVAKACMGESVQLILIEQAKSAWDICVACTVSGSQGESLPLRLTPQGITWTSSSQHAIVNEAPHSSAAWGLARVHLEHAQNLLGLANLAVMTERVSSSRSTSDPRLRREPSFAQLAGAGAAQVDASSTDETLCMVLNACKDMLSQIGPLQTRMTSADACSAMLPAETMDELLSKFLQMVLEAFAVRQGAIVTAMRAAKSHVGASPVTNIFVLLLDVIRALCSVALRDSNSDNTKAMSILLGLVSIMGHSQAAICQVAAGDVLSAIPLNQVLAAATQSIVNLSGSEALHMELITTQYPAVAMGLVQQLAMLASLTGIPPSLDMLSQLLRFHAALGPAEHTPKVPMAQQPLQSPHYRHSHVKKEPAHLEGQDVKLSNNAMKALPVKQRDAVVAVRHIASGGFSAPGQRLSCVTLQAQITRVLTLLLSIPKPPEPVLVTLVSSQQVQLHHHASAFCKLLFAEVSGEPFVLTKALINDLLSSLDLWYVLGVHKGLLLVTAPAAVSRLQKALCRVLDTIAHLPLNQSAIARLSTAPVDPAEVKLAEEPTTAASEALLGLQHYWFWVCSICRFGACAVEAVDMPAWARKSSSKTPRQGSKPVTSSPEHYRGTAASRSYSPKRVYRDSLSPGPLSPPPGRASRSPSASPVTSLVPHTAFVSGAIPMLVDDVESTRHCEELAIGVYQLARAAVRVLAVLEPQREVREIEACSGERWLGMNSALSLQRQCVELSRHLDRNQGDRSVDDVARRKMQDCLVCSLVDVLDYTSQVVQERSQARGDASTKSQALPASHWRQVSTSRTILCRLVDN